LTSIHNYFAAILLGLNSLLGACQSSGFTGQAGKKNGSAHEDSGNNDESFDNDDADNASDSRNGESPSEEIISVGSNKRCYKNIDLVFSLDVSTSMWFTLNQLRQGIGDVVSGAQAKGYVARYGLVVFVDDTHAPRSEPYTTAQDLQNDFSYWAAQTSNERQTRSSGFNMDLQENSLDAIVNAVDYFPWKEGKASRIIMHVTDATFREAPARFASGIPASSTYQDVLTKLKEKQIVLASFTRKNSPLDSQGFNGPYMGKPSLTESSKGKSYDLDQVATGVLNMSTAISDFIVEATCLKE
jgi:hypothetical protein